MPSNATNRKTVRGALAALLTTALVGAGKPAKSVFGYRVSSFKGGPVVVVSSAPAERGKQAQVTRLHSMIDLEIDTFVLYADEAWSEAQSEDLLDDLEKAITDVLMDNDSNETWASLSFRGPTQPDFVTVGGKLYRNETIPVRIQLYSE